MSKVNQTSKHDMNSFPKQHVINTHLVVFHSFSPTEFFLFNLDTAYGPIHGRRTKNPVQSWALHFKCFLPLLRNLQAAT